LYRQHPNMTPVDLVGKLNALAPPGHATYPSLRDPFVNEVIGFLTQSFATATDQQQAEARAALAYDSRCALMGYAWEMAEEAVSQSSAEMVRRGLLALAIEDGIGDARDNIIRLAPLFRSAQKLDLDAEKLFAEAADLTTNSYLKGAMRTFPLRSPEKRDLGKAFFIRERNTREGFRYVQDSLYPHVRRAIWRKKLRRFFRLD
jgi:hypothetical protein